MYRELVYHLVDCSILKILNYYNLTKFSYVLISKCVEYMAAIRGHGI